MSIKDSIKYLDISLKEQLNREWIDTEALKKVQEQLDKIAEISRKGNNQIFEYKLYEIQAYIHFINGNLFKSEKFIERAISLRGHTYFDAEVLINYINNKKYELNESVSKEIRENGKNEMIKGVIIFILGLVITYVSYSNASSKVIETGDSQSYSIWTGAILIGVIGLVRGIYLYITSWHKADEIMNTLQSSQSD